VAHQLERLKDKANVAATQGRTLVFAQGEQIMALQSHRALGGQIQAGQQAEQRGLARSRCPDDGQGLAGVTENVTSCKIVSEPVVSATVFS